MNTEEVKEYLSYYDCDASDLLIDKIPGVTSKFYRQTKALAKTLREVQEEFPDAMFYTTGGSGFGLLLGESHTKDKANQEVCALISPDLAVEGGDW